MKCVGICVLSNHCVSARLTGNELGSEANLIQWPKHNSHDAHTPEVTLSPKACVVKQGHDLHKLNHFTIGIQDDCMYKV